MSAARVIRRILFAASFAEAGEAVVAAPSSLGVWLDGRRVGPLPDAVCGPSPAYDLPRYAARVARIELGPLDV